MRVIVGIRDEGRQYWTLIMRAIVGLRDWGRSLNIPYHSFSSFIPPWAPATVDISNEGCLLATCGLPRARHTLVMKATFSNDRGPVVRRRSRGGQVPLLPASSSCPVTTIEWA